MINNATIPIDSILGLLLPLSYDNKKWLADKLYENIRQESPKSRMGARLAGLESLRQGWDGYNAQPVSRQAAKNLRAVLSLCVDGDIERWLLFPDVDGKLYLDFKSDDVDAGIILSDKTFSFFADDKNEEDIFFAPNIFLQVLRGINQLEV